MEDKPTAVLLTVNLDATRCCVRIVHGRHRLGQIFQRPPLARGDDALFRRIVCHPDRCDCNPTGKVGPTPIGIFIGCMFLVLVALTANSTHAIVGAAAPMDIGGRKMAGFASGVIDSFQYSRQPRACSFCSPMSRVQLLFIDRSGCGGVLMLTILGR